MQRVKEQFNLWLEYPEMDKDLKEELSSIINDSDQIYDRFYKELEFGTGGLRGILGAGTNRMNVYTVGKATQGIADYINKHYGDKHPAMAIAYDSRINSDVFAEEAARVLIGNNIHVYLYPELMPTPALSFAVRHYKCCGGIMITASHNPAKYNGYKVYDEDGCQLTLEAAEEVYQFIQNIDAFSQVRRGIEKLEVIGNEVVEAFLEEVKKESAEVEGTDSLSVVYTPLNGTGNKPVRKILEMIGVRDVKIVEEQELPDGNFPTCTYPNPEKKEALKLGLELCENLQRQGQGPDLLLATDPDCDRVGIAVKTDQGTFELITGNEIGALLLDFICQRRLVASKGESSGKKMPENPVAVKTIVSSKMADDIAKAYGVEMINVLTGFKFIGEQIKNLEKKNQEERYIFGFEESYGYLSGSYVRDKDAVNGSMLICEMTAYYKSIGITLLDRLQELYQTYGYYRNDLLDFGFEGAAGMEKMAAIMKSFRCNAPKEIIGTSVVESRDYEEGILGLPGADVLEYILEDGSSFMVRPSGTEPKLKIYLSAKGRSSAHSEEIINQLRLELTEKINYI